MTRVSISCLNLIELAGVNDIVKNMLYAIRDTLKKFPDTEFSLSFSVEQHTIERYYWCQTKIRVFGDRDFSDSGLRFSFICPEGCSIGNFKVFLASELDKLLFLKYSGSIILANSGEGDIIFRCLSEKR